MFYTLKPIACLYHLYKIRRNYIGPIVSRPTYLNIKKHIGLSNLTKKELECRDKFRVCSPSLPLDIGTKDLFGKKKLRTHATAMSLYFQESISSFGSKLLELFLFTSL